MFGRAIRIGRVFGISIEIDFSWFVIFFLVAWSLSMGYFPYYYPDIAGRYYWSMGIIASLLLFSSVFLHELSHSYIALRNDLPISRITLFIFGGVASMTQEPKSPGVEFRIAIAGPLCSFFLMFLFWLLSIFAEEGRGLFAVLKYASFINGLLAIFNLFPGFPLDGGRLLRSTLWHFTGNLRNSTLIASKIGKGFATFLMAFGFLHILMGNAFNGLWLIFIGYFLQSAAVSSYRQVVIKEILSDLIVEKVMNRHVISVERNITLSELVEKYFLSYHYDCFPVVEWEKVAGIVRMADVKNIPKERWEYTTVDEVMERDIASFSILPESGVEDAFRKMLEKNIGWLLVTNADNTVAGVLTRGDIMHLLEIRIDLEE